MDPIGYVLDLKDGEVAIGVRANDFCFGFEAIIECYSNPVGSGYDVVVGNDMALFVIDKSRASTLSSWATVSREC